MAANEVILTVSKTSYGDSDYDGIYDNAGTSTLEGYDYGDVETGEEYPPEFYYVRHNGEEMVYSVGFFIRSVGTQWGGFVINSPDSKLPYNPNYFRSGGLDETNEPQTSTEDYEMFRTQARDNPEMGVRLHLDRSDEGIRTDGLGFDNQGISSSPITLPISALDFSRPSSNSPVPGRIYPDPLTLEDRGKIGDEAKFGLSIKLGEDLIGGGFAQVSLAISYRFTY